MNINNFIDSIEKKQAMKNKLKNIIEHIAAQFESEYNAESDEKNIEQSKMKISDILAAVQQIWLYEEQQNKDNSSFLSLLTKYEQEIQDRRIKENSRWLLQSFLLLVVDLKPEYNYNAKKLVYSDICSIMICTLRNTTIIIMRVVSIVRTNSYCLSANSSAV